jgi:uncharacterized membrane protein
VSLQQENRVAGADRWLSLAAAPTFAIMALLSATTSGGALEEFCSSAGASWLGGMIPMYLLMSAFHSAPWLKLIAKVWRNRRRAGQRSSSLNPLARAMSAVRFRENPKAARRSGGGRRD